MGRLFIQGLEGNCYSCKCCHTQLALLSELMSKEFHSRNGKAYLFNAVVNVLSGPKEDRLMTTGLHTVSDITCTKCMQVLGWKYDAARENSQKYKVGKFILERGKIVESQAQKLDYRMFLESDDDM
uniref:Protein yippee-like n=1 Tax=Tetraselmis chuii TaxID=63592 RepID=A0A7S1SH82_9CHLO|mmetsp:Transcript_11539/g.20878  ORF Transcript_11539/g.20878 Transcript_11539/m.20878 type:complete len:126 (+) Transcript_11539:813-1190(+)|eukprot:CAMPEP_0177754608 /NCGR_PEP_ID=MMETSP0491_2-20121128/2101_1 /TAXON_ID=63592 /ORGANISM="Tetraselmis chuii, Strain PLY429" /LENGTH=125 /DNA_ID=CAMNT_0019270005 /DNA_START=645 /DNA_END=1022 /DNA_ORIENTATION=-